jgi:hypothetical protein
VVHYRWHALFGRRLRVERVDKRRSGHFVHVELLPGVFTVVAAWMLDASACAGMDLGAPRVSLAALSDLEDLLKRRGLRRCSPGEITAGEGQIDARPVLCFDASRLARNGRDWHHLLELCGLVEARVIDLDGVYDPAGRMTVCCSA